MIDWKEFNKGAARALWADAYITEIEGRIEDGEVSYQEARGNIVPGPGGAWEDYIPEVPRAAMTDAKKFTKKFLTHLNDAALDKLDRIATEIGNDGVGWYAMMDALGHGVGLFDYGFRLEESVDWHTPTSVYNAAYTVVEKTIRQFS